MRSIRRLPPLLRGLWLLALLAVLASLGVDTWAFLLVGGNGAQPPQQLYVVWALMDFGFACGWPVAVYNWRYTPSRRPARPAPWLDSWRGQLMSTVVLAGLLVVAALVGILVSPGAPLFSLPYTFDILIPLAFFAAWVWAIR